MTEDTKVNCEDGRMEQSALERALEVLRERFSTVQVETSVGDGGSALSVRFLGDETDLEARRLLAKSLADYLPATLSIIGVQPGRAGEADTRVGNNGGDSK